MKPNKRIRPQTDDGSPIGRPPCKPVEWTAHTIDNPAGKITVVAQTWFYAREKACAILGTDPQELVVVQNTQINSQTSTLKPATNSCPSCSPGKPSKTVSCKSKT